MIRKVLTAMVVFFVGQSLHAQFINEYWRAPNMGTSFHAITPVNDNPNSNLYISGTFGKQIFVGEFRQNGNVVWARRIQINDPGYIINSMIKDSDGNLLLCGSKYTGPGDDGFGFLIKFDPVSKMEMWSQKCTVNALFFDCAEIEPGGNYVIGGQEEGIGGGNQADHLSMIADRNTGDLTVLSNLNSRINDNIDALVVESASHAIYTTGRYELDPGGNGKFRICLDKLNMDSTVVDWTKYYIKNLASTGRFYPKDIIQDGDAFLIAGCGDDAGTNSFKNLYLLKVDLDGNLIWTKKYDIAGTSYDGVFSCIRKYDGGYAIAGSLYAAGYTDIFVFNVDTNGDLLWAQSYPYRKVTNAFGLQMTSSLAVIGTKIFHVGERLKDDGTLRGILMQIDMENSIGYCADDLEVTTTDYTNYQGNYTMDIESAEIPYTAMEPETKLMKYFIESSCEINTREGGQNILQLPAMHIYPNPAQEALHMNISDDLVGVDVKIVDATGRVMLVVTLESNDLDIDLTGFDNGLYFIQTIDATKEANVSFIVIK